MSRVMTPKTLCGVCGDVVEQDAGMFCWTKPCACESQTWRIERGILGEWCVVAPAGWEPQQILRAGELLRQRFDDAGIAQKVYVLPYRLPGE